MIKICIWFFVIAFSAANVEIKVGPGTQCGPGSNSISSLREKYPTAISIVRVELNTGMATCAACNCPAGHYFKVTLPERTPPLAFNPRRVLRPSRNTSSA